MRTTLPFATAFVLTVAAGGLAAACQCTDQVEARGGRDGKALMASRLDRAAIVVRGKFVGVQAGEGVNLPDQLQGEQSSNIASRTVFPGRRVAVGTFKVSEAVKGQVSGTVKVFSGLGMGDCGAGATFLGAVAYDADVSVELKPIFKAPNSYAMDMCGYMESHRRGE